MRLVASVPRTLHNHARYCLGTARALYHNAHEPSFTMRGSHTPAAFKECPPAHGMNYVLRKGRGTAGYLVGLPCTQEPPRSWKIISQTWLKVLEPGQGVTSEATPFACGPQHLKVVAKNGIKLESHETQP